MSFSAQDYLARLSKASHSDYVSSYSALNEVMRTLTIEPQSFHLSKQQFEDQPVNTLFSGGTRQTRAPLGARGSATCCCVQTCQVNWTITIPANTLGIQLNSVNTTKGQLTDIEFARQLTNFNGTKTAAAPLPNERTIKQDVQKYSDAEVLKFWLGFATACGPFQQVAICKQNTKLWETSIYAREQAIICSNSLSDLTVNNSVTVSPLESITQGKRHCGVFIDIPCSKLNTSTNDYFYKIPEPITFSGALDLNQLNPIFNEFPVLTRNYASLYLQLWMTDFLQDLKIVWLNKINPIFDQHLAYTMIPPEKPDLIFLLTNEEGIQYKQYSVRIINCRDLADDSTDPKNSIQQIDNAYFEYLSIHNLCFTMENEQAIIDMIRAQKVIHFPTQVIKSQSSNYTMNNFEPSSGQIQSIMSFANIKAMFMTFAMPQYPTWFFPMLLHNIDLIIDQRHAVPFPYEAHTQATNGSMFQCFVDQDVISPSSDLYHSLTFENININDKKYWYGKNDGAINDIDNVFYKTTLFIGSKAVKTYYPNKYMLAWKLATDDSFMRGFNSTRVGARTDIQLMLNTQIITGIVDNHKINDDTIHPENQNTLAGFMGTRSYPMSWQVGQTPMFHYLCDAVIRIMFDDNPEPQVLNLEVIGEISGSMIAAG
ncbi:MAG: hypothetical protein EZS28_017952 [Streblomastix strix]|uniref:Major capsid protein n=1 Tax=Streblomastix strix TaxID=222440 RepID=A0A5J4VVH0_9EUKA|nr:MAG: hypothetical protein EZS28_017952 [Streblomastix strix]